MASLIIPLLSLLLILMLFAAILTYIFRCIILVRFYIKSAYQEQAGMLPFLYTLLAIFIGALAVYLAKCEYEAITKK